MSSTSPSRGSSKFAAACAPGDREYTAGQRLLRRVRVNLGSRFIDYVVVDGGNLPLLLFCTSREKRAGPWWLG